jgi:hypothetical protein
VHGEQPGKFFNGYYDHHCYFPLYVFCGRHLLVSYLRTSNRSDSRHSWAILALLVRFIRQYWPETRIVFRGDCAFYRPRILSWCDRHNVDYLVGISLCLPLPTCSARNGVRARKATSNAVSKKGSQAPSEELKKGSRFKLSRAVASFDE